MSEPHRVSHNFPDTFDKPASPASSRRMKAGTELDGGDIPAAFYNTLADDTTEDWTEAPKSDPKERRSKSKIEEEILFSQAKKYIQDLFANYNPKETQSKIENTLFFTFGPQACPQSYIQFSARHDVDCIHLSAHAIPCHYHNDLLRLATLENIHEHAFILFAPNKYNTTSC